RPSRLSSFMSRTALPTAACWRPCWVALSTVSRGWRWVGFCGALGFSVLPGWGTACGPAPETRLACWPSVVPITASRRWISSVPRFEGEPMLMAGCLLGGCLVRAHRAVVRLQDGEMAFECAQQVAQAFELRCDQLAD